VDKNTFRKDVYLKWDCDKTLESLKMFIQYIKTYEVDEDEEVYIIDEIVPYFFTQTRFKLDIKLFRELYYSLRSKNAKRKFSVILDAGFE
jgi:hypothetical protein